MKDKLAFFNSRLRMSFGKYLYTMNEKKKEAAQKRLEEVLKKVGEISKTNGEIKQGSEK